MPFRQPSAVRADHERDVGELRRRQMEGAGEEHLPGGGRDQIVPADHFRDAERLKAVVQGTAY